MKVTEIVQISFSEQRALKFFQSYCWPEGKRFCPRCFHERIYLLKAGGYRCGACGLSFSDFTGRWLARMNLSAVEWLWIIKLFEIGVSARKAAQEVDISYPSALKAFNLLRTCIVAHGPDSQVLLGGEVEIDESYFGGRRKGKRGRGAKNKIPVFGILEREGQVRVEILKDLKAETLLGLTVKMVRRGSIVYTDKFRGYDSLMFCGYRHLRVDHQKRFSSGKVYINGLEGFWSFAKERLMKHHGISKEHFPLYIKEMEFRYNNRNHNLFIVLVNLMCDFVSKVL